MNRMEKALAGVITPEMKQVALQEGVTPEFVRKGVAEGTIVILHNTSRRDGVPLGVGTGLRTKVSTSIGLYGEDATVEGEVAKIRAAVDAGTDAIMDLSVSGDIEGMLKKTLEVTSKPVGTLPLYQALAESARKYGSSLLSGTGGEPVCAACGPDCAVRVAAAYYGIKTCNEPVSPGA